MPYYLRNVQSYTNFKFDKYIQRVHANKRLLNLEVKGAWAYPGSAKMCEQSQWVGLVETVDYMTVRRVCIGRTVCYDRKWIVNDALWIWLLLLVGLTLKPNLWPTLYLGLFSRPLNVLSRRVSASDPCLLTRAERTRRCYKLRTVKTAAFVFIVVSHIYCENKVR